MSEKISKGRNIWQMALLAIILIGFPLGSWIYLTKGMNYQLEVRDQMRKTHRLTSSGPLQIIKGKQAETLMGNMYLVTLLPNSEQLDLDEFAATFKRLHDQFDNPTNIQFWNVFEKGDSSIVSNFVKENEVIEDDEQIVYFGGDRSMLNTFSNQFGFTEDELADRGKYPQIVMIDDSLYIRRVFRADDMDEIKQLVEATALLLPERSKPRARVVRETEK